MIKYVPSANQTWLTEESSSNGGFHRKIIELNGGLCPAMVDYRSPVQEILSLEREVPESQLDL